MGETNLTAERSGRRERLKVANRQAILEAARSVFARIGYEATTVREIVRETQLAAGTFYNYFKSKEEVFHALASSSAAQFRPVLREVCENTDNFEDFINGAYRAYFQFLNDANSAAISTGAPHMALIGVRVDTPEMEAVFEEIRGDIEAMLAVGEIEKIDTEYLTAAAIGIARDVGDHMLQRRPVDVEKATAFATALLLSGISGLVGQE